MTSKTKGPKKTSEPKKTRRVTKKVDTSSAIEPEVLDSDQPTPEFISEDKTPLPESTIREIEKSPIRLPTIASSNLPATTDPLAMYLAEIRNYPLLTPEEERELAFRFKDQGDKNAAERLVTSNLRFVVKIAAEYSKFGAKMIDLIQEGNVGLMHAVKEFNPHKGVRLITYAVWWIRGYIREFLMRQYSMVRLGTTHNQKKLFYNLQQEERRLEGLGQEFDVRALSDRLGIPENEIESMKQRLQSRDLSLDQPFDDDSKSSLLDFQASPEGTSPEDLLVHQEEIEHLKSKIEKIRPELNSKELYILENRLLADEPMTLQEIGDHMGITRERTRQIEAKVMDRIKSSFLPEVADPKNAAREAATFSKPNGKK